MLRLRSASAAVGTALLLITGAVSAVAAGDESEVRGDAAVLAVDAAEPTDLVDLSFETDGDSFASESEALHVDVPKDALLDDVVLSEPGSTSGHSAPFGIGLPDLELDPPKLAADGKALVFSSTTSGVEVVVQAQSDSAQIATVLQDSEAPEEYRYELAVPEGGTVSVIDGFVTVKDQSGTPVGYVAPAWAKDANGVDVPSSYVLDGDTLVQKVEHRGPGFAYPVVADPYAGRALIKSARWKYVSRDGPFGAGRSLEVTATEWAWKWSGSGEANHLRAAANAGWSELRAKYPSLNRHLGAMKDQYICHAEYAAGYYGNRRPGWTLDEWRPDRSYAITVRYKCNVPAGGPYRY